MSVRVTVSPDLLAFFGAARALPREIRGEASNNLPYALRLLEYGWSRQLPRYWLRQRRRFHEQLAAREIDHALQALDGNLAQSLTAGVSAATLGVTRDVADHTPVDTGRAKGAWVARLPNGQRVETGPRISAAQAARMRRDRPRPGAGT